MKFKFYCDPGHGWLAVKRTLLDELGIAHLISPYSYAKGGTVYLEEDCDASVFFKAYKDLHGSEPEYIVVHYDYVDSPPVPCRSYPDYVNPAYDPDGYRKFLGYA